MENMNVGGYIVVFNLEFNAGITHLAWVSSDRDSGCSEQIYTAAKFEGKI